MSEGAQSDSVPEEPSLVEAVDTVRDSHDDYLGLAVAASAGDLEQFREHAEELRKTIESAEEIVADATEGDA